ncbi:hypothetical protein GQ457_04G011780 [Hibiscus cannabinus]
MNGVIKNEMNETPEVIGSDSQGKEDLQNKDKATYAVWRPKPRSINGGLGVANEDVIVLEEDVIIDR